MPCLDLLPVAGREDAVGEEIGYAVVYGGLFPFVRKDRCLDFVTGISDGFLQSFQLYLQLGGGGGGHRPRNSGAQSE